MKLQFALFFSMIFTFCGTAQVTNQGKPKSWDLKNIESLNPILLPKVDIKKLQEEDLVNDKRKDMPWRFGTEIIVDNNLSNSGQWTTLANGDRIWRIRYASKGAKTMNFFFSDFFMPRGATLYLYSNNHSDLLGAYDSAQNNDEQVLGTWLVKGADIWLEYYEPASVRNQGKLEVFKVIHGYRSSEDNLKSPDDDLNASGSCNYDVNCSMGAIDALKDINKKAVGLIIVNNTGHCTGALINNTSNNGTPYFLTANHCYSNPSSWSFRFKWISPNPVCAQNTASTNTSNVLTISGATLKARRAESDFCLVQINSAIPATWDVKWAGWDRSTLAPSSTFGIHHPSGDIMKVCLDNNPPISLNDSGNYWMVQDWDMGVTEGGSSGSPFFNNLGRIIGQLWRGSAACSGTTDNGGSDDYGRFDTSWSAGTTSATRLKDWLDPTNTNAMTTDVYPPAQPFAVDAKASIIGLANIICGNTINPSIRITNNGTTVLTSALVSYALNLDFPTELNWTGSLAQGQSADIPVGPITVTTAANSFYGIIDNPNGIADQSTGNNEASISFTKAEEYETTQLKLTIVTDDYGTETAWNVKGSNNTVIASGGPYASNATINHTINLPDEDCYTFSISDAEGDGICCAWGSGSYSLRTSDDTVIITGGDFGSGESIVFGAGENLSNEEFVSNGIKVYPNPSSGIFNLST
jgi:lysyl endopeptidase